MPATRRNDYRLKKQPTLFRPKEEDFLAYALLEHVLHGNREEAKALYEMRPDLLFCTATGIDCAFGLDENFEPVRRVITSTPYRAMAASGNVWMLNDLLNNEAIKNYIDPISRKSSYQLMAEQLQAQFPNGFSYPLPQYNLSQLTNIIHTDFNLKVTNQPSTLTSKALSGFREDFLPNLKFQVDVTGYYFNMLECAHAYFCLDKLSNTWNQNQINFFFVQITGNLINLLSYTDAVLFLKIHEARITTPDDEVNNTISHFTTEFLNLQNKGESTSLFTHDPACRLGRDFSLNVETPMENNASNQVIGTGHYRSSFDFPTAIIQLQAMKVTYLQKHFQALETALQNTIRPCQFAANHS